MPKQTILIVEDDLQYRKMSRQFLIKEGYTVFEACNGEEAIQLYEAKKLKLDLLFTDVIMPKIDGVTLAEQLCALDPGIKVIFTSGYSTKRKIEKNLQNEEIHFIEKPYKMTALLEKIQFVLKEE